MYSTPLKGTNTKKIKLSWFDYYFSHCWMTGWQSIRSNFRMWGDLMGGNYEGYGLLKDDNPYEECLEWFWASLNEDDVYPKSFLEELLQLVDDVDSGKVETVPLTEDFYDRMKDLIVDMD